MVALDLASLRTRNKLRGMVLNTDPATAVQSALTKSIAPLFPPGLAWNWKKGGVGDRIKAAISDELAQAVLLVEKLLREADPQQTLELLADFERELDLPSDAFAGIFQDEASRRAAIVDLLRGRETATLAYLASIPGVFNFTADSRTRAPARTGTWRAGHPIWGPAWQFWANLNVHTTQSVAGVEALLETHVPAHAKVAVTQGHFDLRTLRTRNRLNGVNLNGPVQPPTQPQGEDDTGTALIQLKPPTSVTSINACVAAYISVPDYQPFVYFEYRQVGTTTWLSTTPRRITRARHWRYANYYELLEGLVPGTLYEYRVWVSDKTGTLVNYSTNLATNPTRQFTTVGSIADGSQWGTRAHTSGVTLPTWADPGDSNSGEVHPISNPHVWTSNVQRAGGASGFDLIVYATDNPSGRTPGTIEAFHVVTANASTDRLTTAAWHFLPANTQVVLASSGALPTPLVAGTTYFVRNPVSATVSTPATLQLATTSGGTPIDLTDAGSGVITLTATFSYSSNFMSNTITQHAVIGSVIGLEGFEGRRASYNATVLAALTAAGNVHIYDEGNGSVYEVRLGGGASSPQGRDAYWQVGSTKVPVVGISIVGIGTVTFANTPLFTPGEPIMYLTAGSLLGGFSNVWVRNLKLMSVTGNTSRIGGGQAFRTNAEANSVGNDCRQTTAGQAVGLLGIKDCAQRAFREWTAPITATGYANEDGWGCKSHNRWVGQFRLMADGWYASWTREHKLYTEAMSCARTGKGPTVLVKLRSQPGSTPGLLDPNNQGYQRQVLQTAGRSNPDAFCNSGGCVIQQGEYTGALLSNYWDGPASWGQLELWDVLEDGNTIGGVNGGTEPYALYGWLGPILIGTAVYGGRGVGFSLLCDTGKGMYLREGADGFFYGFGPLTVEFYGNAPGANSAYSDGGLNINSCESVHIKGFALSSINRTGINLYTAAGDGSQEGIALGENGFVKITPVASNLAAYPGWPGSAMRYRTGAGAEITYTPAQLEKFIAGVSRTGAGGFANP